MSKKIEFSNGFTVWEAMNSGFTVWDVANEALATIERVRALYERTCEATNDGCSDDLEEFLADLSLALDGEQE